jgi:YD repeat-containing protein
VNASIDRDWHIYRGTGDPHDDVDLLPEPPPWRRFDGAHSTELMPEIGIDAEIRPGELARARAYRPPGDLLDTVNAALFLRRPLLVTGKPGVGKSTLAYSIAHELRLGPVLYWPITSRSTLADAQYTYDAIGRLQETNLRRGEGGDGAVPEIGRYLRLGALGTALLPWRRPRVLLIDELDKSDIDLPNDLLNVFEEGQFEILELTRLPDEQQPVTVRTADGATVKINRGLVRCHAFPLVVITNNGEREFPPAFLRRCLRLYIQPPDADKLREIVASQLGDEALQANDHLVDAFLAARESADLSTDQLLNLIFLTTTGRRPSPELRERLMSVLLRPLGSPT